MTTANNSWRRGALPLWLPIAAIVLTTLALRPAVTSISPLFKAIEHNTGAGTLFLSVLAMAPPIAFSLSGIVVPRLASVLGIERLTAIAMALCAIGLLVRAAVPQPAGILFFTAVALAGTGVANVTIPALVRTFAGSRLPLMTTVYITALQVGTLVPALAAVPIAESTSWRLSLGLWSVVAIAACMAWVAHLIRGGTSSEQRNPPTGPPTGTGVSRSTLAICLAVMMGSASLVTFTMFGWVPTIIVNAGGTAELGGSMLALFAFLGLPPSLLIPRLLVLMPNPYPLAVGSGLCYAAGIIGLWLAPITATPTWIVLAGLGTSVFPLSLALITLRARTTNGVVVLSAFVHAVGYLIASAGPFLFGFLNTITDSVNASFGLLLVSLSIMVICARRACRVDMVEDEIERRASRNT